MLPLDGDRTVISRRTLAAFTFALVATLLVPFAWTIAATPDEPPVRRSDEFDDPAQPFVPTRRPSSREADRVHALALFSAARIAEDKQDSPRALRLYERRAV